MNIKMVSMDLLTQRIDLSIGPPKLSEQILESLQILRTLKRTLLIVFSFYALIVLALYRAQRHLMFVADSNRVQLEQADLPGVQEIILKTDQGDALICWYGPSKPGESTFLIFHGNGGNIGSRSMIFRQLMAKGYGVFMLGYPGYGGSDGSPSESAFMAAADLAYNRLVEEQISPSDIVIYGESLGSSVATQLAARRDSRALILLAPPKSALHVASAQYPFVPVEWLLKDTFRTDLHIEKVTEPLLMIHGRNDDIIPISHSHALFELANQPKTLKVIEAAGHNDLYDYPAVDVMSEFLNQLSSD